MYDDKRSVLKIGWECSYPTDPIIGEVIEKIDFS